MTGGGRSPCFSIEVFGEINGGHVVQATLSGGALRITGGACFPIDVLG